jgi:hypothetical protein
MVNRALFINGVNSTDELSKLGGLELADKYSKADLVIFVNNNKYRVVKSKVLYETEYFDANNLRQKPRRE